MGGLPRGKLLSACSEKDLAGELQRRFGWQWALLTKKQREGSRLMFNANFGVGKLMQEISARIPYDSSLAKAFRRHS